MHFDMLLDTSTWIYCLLDRIQFLSETHFFAFTEALFPGVDMKQDKI